MMSELKRTRITSDGTMEGTKIEGHDLAYKAVIALDADRRPLATIWERGPILDVTADAKVITICPFCRNGTKNQCHCFQCEYWGGREGEGFHVCLYKEMSGERPDMIDPATLQDSLRTGPDFGCIHFKRRDSA